ncbi:MAG: hypothetical protein BWY31_01947 [Lentisphaerae bacterium ADurb.Bin242]|nr:MAG: hypothetical protein BWY31_01947 [Lentisphaerae bacterium ADurb.Bin242]
MNQDIEKNHPEEKEPVENDLFSLGHIKPQSPPEPKEEPVSPLRTMETAAPAAEKSASATVPETAPAEEKSSFRTFPEKTAPEPVSESIPEVTSPPPPPVKRRSLRAGAGASLGALLAEARNSAGLSVEKVSESTRIRVNHLNALESDNLSGLPSAVYIRAYVRTLVKLYNLDGKAMDLIDEHLRELEPSKDVPEKLLEDLGKDVQISKDEAKKIRMIFFYVGGIILLLISLTVTSIVAINIRNARNHQRQTPVELRPFESRQLEKLLPQQVPETKMLKPPPAK